MTESKFSVDIQSSLCPQALLEEGTHRKSTICPYVLIPQSEQICSLAKHFTDHS